MKRKNLFIGILLLSIGLAGCENDLTNPPVYQPSQTTKLKGEIDLWAKSYTKEQAKGLSNWGDVESGDGGWWECDPRNNDLALSKLMPNGEIKNNTTYEVTVSGNTDVPLEHFQFMFTVPGHFPTLPWMDLSNYTDAPISEGVFSITKTLTTFGVVESGTDHEGNLQETDVKSLLWKGALAFTNGVHVPLVDPPAEGEPFPPDVRKATLTNVVVTITEM